MLVRCVANLGSRWLCGLNRFPKPFLILSYGWSLAAPGPELSLQNRHSRLGGWMQDVRWGSCRRWDLHWHKMLTQVGLWHSGWHRHCPRVGRLPAVLKVAFCVLKS